MNKTATQMNFVSKIMFELSNQLSSSTSTDATDFVTKHNIDRSRPIKFIEHAVKICDMLLLDVIGQDIVNIEYFPNDVKKENLVVEKKDQALRYQRYAKGDENKLWLGYNSILFKEAVTQSISSIKTQNSIKTENPIKTQTSIKTQAPNIVIKQQVGQTMSFNNGVLSVVSEADNDFDSDEFSGFMNCRVIGEGCFVPKLTMGDIDHGTEICLISTNKGIFTIYDNNAFVVKNYTSAKRDVSAKNCSDIEKFKEHLAWCGISVLQVTKI